MTSMLEQYEQAHARAAMVQHLPSGDRDASQSTLLEDDDPIFSRKRIDFRPRSAITHLIVSDNYLVMAMMGNIIMRVDRDNKGRSESATEIEVGKSSEKIHKIYLDPTGRHLLISMTSGDNYYMVRSTAKPRLLQRMRGQVVDSVGWNRQNTSEQTTSNILIGTNDGCIYETVIQNADDRSFFLTASDPVWKQVFNLGDAGRASITGIEFDRMPHTQASDYKYFIIVTTSSHRMYQFIGVISNSSEPPIFQKIFSRYEDVPDEFIELPGNSSASGLELFHPNFRATPNAFAWMCGAGVYYGVTEMENADVQRTVVKDAQLVPFRESRQGPLGITLTEFHVLIVYSDRVMAVCLLNERVVSNDLLPDRYGRFRGIVKDSMTGTIWAFTDQYVFNYAVSREPRDVWKIYLDKEDFENAKKYAKDNIMNTNTVQTKHAQALFSRGEYNEAAVLYAKTFASFEEVALKFVQCGEENALKTFLSKKLASFTPEDKTQITMVVTWLIEIFLNQLGALREQGQGISDLYDTLQEDFRMLLSYSKVRECLSLNSSTIYDLIASHGDVENMVFFAFLMKDYERIVEHYIQHSEYLDALNVLRKQGANNSGLMYKYAPALIEKVPIDTVKVWKELKNKLDPEKLIPALVQYDATRKKDSKDNCAVNYLEYCIEMLDSKNVAIHNYLVAQYAGNQLEHKLMTYLHVQGDDPEYINYDMKYGLRLCSEHSMKRACVHIYTLMHLYEEAVDLALQIDVDLAKRNAEKPEDDEELRKKLWLRIARHVVEEEKDIEKAMEFLQECNLLKIEDILPFFPDFVTIDHFKDAICSSLNDYNTHIESLKQEMDQATTSAEHIRADIQMFRNKYTFVKAQDKCTSCNFPLMTRFFYVFPCGHRFHGDCLIDEILPHLTPARRRRVEEMQKRLFSSESRHGSVGGALTRHERNQAEKTELDDLISSDCVLCGKYMINLIDKPFISPEEYEEDLQSWM